MTSDPSMRAGDADRDRTVGILREAFAEGRLTEAEFNERVGAATAAKTYADLAVLTTDLPNGGPAAAGAGPVSPGPPPAAYSPAPPVAYPASPAPTAASPDRRAGDERKSLRAGWAAWAGVSVLCTVLWLMSVVTRGGGDIPGFWPLWVIGPWGAVMIMASIMGSGRD